MSFSYRCSKCRGRNLFRRALDAYILIPKCRHCGYQKFYVDWERVKRRRLEICACGGYHFKHREGSPMCEKNENYEFNVRTRRYGEDPDEVRLDIAFNSAAQTEFETEGCPF